MLRPPSPYTTAYPLTSLAALDPAAETCSYNGQNIVLLVSRKLSETQVKQAITKECKKPKCPCKKTWNEKLGKCEYPKLPKEDADKCTKKGGKPVCAKKPSEHCPYSRLPPPAVSPACN